MTLACKNTLKGKNVILLGRQESVYGVVHHVNNAPPVGCGVAPASTNPVFRIPITSESLVNSKNLIQSNILPGDRDEVDFYMVGNSDPNGSIDGEIMPEGLEIIWLHAIGTPLGQGVVTTGSGPFVHTYNSGRLPTSMTLEKIFTDAQPTPVALRYPGSRINTLTFTFNQEGPSTWSAAILSAAEIEPEYIVLPGNPTWDQAPLSSYPIPNVPAKKSFNSKFIRLYDDGERVGNATSLTLTIDNQMDAAEFFLGTDGRGGSTESIRLITGTMEASFKDFDIYRKFINSTTSSLQVVMSNEFGDKFDLILPKIIYGGTTPTAADPGPIQVSIPFSAFIDPDIGSALVLKLTNGVSSVPLSI